MPPGFRLEKLAGELTYPTSLTFDDQGRLYVVGAGGQFVEEPPPARILRIEDGRATEVVNLTARGLQDSVVGMTFFRGAFYVTHRAADRTGAVSRVAMDGTVTPLITGILDSASEHQVNDIKPGPDGRLYFASGQAANAGVLGLDNGPSIERTPGLRPTPCRDLTLLGRDFVTPDFRTPDPSDTARTGAFVPLR